MTYNILPLKEWLEYREFFKVNNDSAINDRIKSILTSNGSLTRLLEDLYGSQIGIELKGQSVSYVEQDTSDFLEIKKGEEVIDRNAWLKIGKERLVFACSVIILKGLDESSIYTLKAGEKPLGVLLEDTGLSIRRDSLRICMIRCKEIAEDLLLPLDHSFCARRYRIRSGNKVLAGITEVFSPNLFESE